MDRACKQRKTAGRNGDEDVQWLNLPWGPLSFIFSMLDLESMLFSVPLVCRYWGRLILEPLFYKYSENSLDFGGLKGEACYNLFFGMGDENSRAMKLTNLLVGVMNAFGADDDSGNWVTSITMMVFPTGLELRDRHLVYIAERTPELKRLHLRCAKHITGEGFSRAIRCWSRIEQIILEPFIFYPRLSPHAPRIIREMGINCMNLENLVLTGLRFQWHSSALIAGNLKSLKILGLHNAYVSRFGVQIFLERCKKLRAMRFLRCQFLNDKEFPCYFNIVGIRDGHGTKWCTAKIKEPQSPKDLLKLLWQPTN